MTALESPGMKSLATLPLLVKEKNRGKLETGLVLHGTAGTMVGDPSLLYRIS